MKFVFSIVLIFCALAISKLYAQGYPDRASTQSMVRGDNLMKVFNWYEAINEYNTAIAVDPYYADAYYKRSIAFSKVGRFDEAKNDQNKAIAINPNIGYILDYRAQLYLIEEDYNNAIVDLLAAVSINPDEEDYRFRLGNAQINQGDYQDAVNTFSGIIDKDQTDTLAYILRAVANIHLEEHQKALTDLNRVLNIHPENELALEVRGLEYLRTEKYDWL